MTLYVINPNSTESVTDGIADVLQPFRSWGHPIQCLTIQEGPPGIETQAHIDAVIEPTINLALSLPDATGIVIACFSDPGVVELRNRTALPVFGIREAAIASALTLGETFGIIAIRDISIPRHLAAVDHMGLTSRLAGDRALELGVTELDDEDLTRDRLLETARQLRDLDGAKVLILGCAGMARYRETVEHEIGLPTIDPCQAAVALALSRITVTSTTR